MTKTELERCCAELNGILHAWDPLGLSNPPLDEYDCLVGPLLTLLNSGATASQIESHLHNELIQHFGVTPMPNELSSIVIKLRTWFDREWRNPARRQTRGTDHRPH